MAPDGCDHGFAVPVGWTGLVCARTGCLHGPQGSRHTRAYAGWHDVAGRHLSTPRGGDLSCHPDADALLRQGGGPDLRLRQTGGLRPHCYIVVIQDVRGQYTSEGEFYPFRDEASDG